MTPRKRSLIRAGQIKARKAKRTLAPEPEPPPPARKTWRWYLVIVVIVIAAIIARAAWPSGEKAKMEKSRAGTDAPLTLEELVKLKPHQLEEVDIAEMNLLCAQGLRGSEGLDITKALTRLNEMAARVRQETERHMYRFHSKPDEYENSEAYFRMMMLRMVLHEDFGIRYNPKRITSPEIFEANEKFYASSKDSFIHGLTELPGMGTCASMPVLIVAVGRRLKYPLALVSAKAHLFVRWQDAKERRNIEATSNGFLSDPDEHYKSWPYPIRDDEIEPYGLLKSKTASEELACFLSTRAMCLMTWNRCRESVICAREANRIAPQLTGYRAMVEWLELEASAREMFDRRLQIDQVNWLLDHEGESGIPYPTRARRNKFLPSAEPVIRSPSSTVSPRP